MADLNKILHNTAFNPRVSNPCFLLAVLISLGSSGIFTSSMTSSIDFNEKLEERWDGETVTREDSGSSIGVSIGGFLLGGFLPFLVFFIIVAITKSSRKRQLTNYVGDWNR